MNKPPIAFPQTTGSQFLPGPAGRLELAIDLPEAAIARRGLAVICHPNPPDGGTLHNKVVTMCARALNEQGITTVRFNFRGVGQSDGSFDNGRGEVLDLMAVAEWAHLANPDAQAQVLHPLARLLAARYGEQRRIEDLLEKQNQQTREVQRRLDQTNERLEALKAIERSLTSRPPAPAPAASAPASRPRRPAAPAPFQPARCLP